jgi:ribosomal 30S subunit maturation factor RimM
MALAELSKLDDFEVADESVDIRGFPVYNKMGDYLGDVDELLVDPVAMKVRYVIIDAGTWLESKKFIVPVGMIEIDDTSHRVFLGSLTRETIHRLPAYNESRWTDPDYERELLSIYYPDRAGSFGQFTYETEEAFRYPRRFETRETPFRRRDIYSPGESRLGWMDTCKINDNLWDLKGYEVYGKNNEYLGTVARYCGYKDTQQTEYLVVDTGGWLVGEKFLVPVNRIRIDPAARRIYIDNLTRAQVETLPKYDESRLFSPEYENELRRAYQYIV